MKRILPTVALIALAGAMTTESALVTYNFNSGLDDSTSGSDLTAGTVSYAVGTQSSGNPQSSERAWDQTSPSGNYLLNFGQRGLGNSGTDDAALTMTGAATLRFTLTPNSGESLDLSLSSLSFDQLIYADSGNVNFGYKIWADTGSGFAAVDTLQTAGLTYADGTENKLLKTDQTSNLPGFDLTAGSIQSKDSAFSFDISSIGPLAVDQSVTLAIAMSANRNNHLNFGNGIDNLVVDSVVIPEPATLGLIGMAGVGLFMVRRKRLP